MYLQTRARSASFAGSSTTAIANLIDDVLDCLVSMVDLALWSASWGKYWHGKKLFSVAESSCQCAITPQASQTAVDAVRKVKECHEVGY
jgi:hypothetical protein